MTTDRSTSPVADVLADAFDATDSPDTTDEDRLPCGVSRRALLRLTAAGALGAGVAAASGSGLPFLAQKGLLSTNGAFAATSTALADLLFYTEVFPTSPLILNPFSDPLVIPKAAIPVKPEELATWTSKPSGALNMQNSLHNETHQIWPSALGYPDPIVYKIDVKVATHAFTTSKVRPITKDGRPAASFDEQGKPRAVGAEQYLPRSTIYGFNGTFPGPRINAEYGKPVV